VRQGAALAGIEQRPRDDSSFTFVIDARVLFVASHATRRVVARDLVILLIAHKDTVAQRRERLLPTVRGI